MNIEELRTDELENNCFVDILMQDSEKCKIGFSVLHHKNIKNIMIIVIK